MEGRGSINGVYDPNNGSIIAAQETHSQYVPGGELELYDTLDEACDDPAVDGLIIATPNYTHIDVVRRAAESGKHIFLEKPMATTIPDAYEIMMMAENHANVFQIGLQYRYKPMYTEVIHEALERKSAGDVKMISIVEHRIPFLDKVNQWNKFSEYSGGTLVEKCCHYFDLINLIAGGRPQRVFATGRQAVNFIEFEYEGRKSDILDSATVTIDYDNGVQGMFNLCMFAPMFFEEITVAGDEGHIKAHENRTFMPDSDPESYMHVLRGEYGPSRISRPQYPVSVAHSGHGGATYFEHQSLIDNMQGKETNAASAAEGFWSVVVGAAAERSAHSGQVVNIPDLLQEYNIDL